MPSFRPRSVLRCRTCHRSSGFPACLFRPRRSPGARSLRRRARRTRRVPRGRDLRSYEARRRRLAGRRRPTRRDRSVWKRWTHSVGISTQMSSPRWASQRGPSPTAAWASRATSTSSCRRSASSPKGLDRFPDAVGERRRRRGSTRARDRIVLEVFGKGAARLPLPARLHERGRDVRRVVEDAPASEGDCESIAHAVVLPGDAGRALERKSSGARPDRHGFTQGLRCGATAAQGLQLSPLVLQQAVEPARPGSRETTVTCRPSTRRLLPT
jgi:hypothetical protein